MCAIWNCVFLQRYLSTYHCVLSNSALSLSLNHTQSAHHIPCFSLVWLGFGQSHGSHLVKGVHGSGLCSTRDQPNDIEFPVRRPAANHRNPRVKSDWTRLVGGRVGRSWEDAAGGSNRQQSAFFSRSSSDLSKSH